MSNEEYFEALLQIEKGTIAPSGELKDKMHQKRTQILYELESSRNKALDKMYESHYKELFKMQKYTLIGVVLFAIASFIIFILAHE